MGGHNDTTRTCSVCRGQGVLRALHSKRECLICDNKYESVTLNNQKFFYTSSTSMCNLCQSVCVIDSMESVVVSCPHCLGTGVRTWIDKMIRPYNKSRLENELFRIIVRTDEGFREGYELD